MEYAFTLFEHGSLAETIFGFLFVFLITLLIGGAFLYALWFDARVRLWKRNFERDTITTLATVTSHTDNDEDGLRTVHYRFEDSHGIIRSGAQSFVKMAVTERFDVSNHIKIHYHRDFPNHLSFVDGYEKNFARSSRFIGFFIVMILFFAWFFH